MGKVAPALEIRAHHLLCILGFRGFGYSQEFIVKMEKVVKELDANATFPITVMAECDVICASCPHNRGNKCLKEADSEAKIKNRDLEVLQRLDFEVGAQMPVAEVWTRIRAKLTLRDVAEICLTCEWQKFGYCAQGLARLRIGQ